MASPDPHVTDQHRDEIAAAIAAALLLLYKAGTARAFAKLKRPPQDLTTRYSVQHKINAKAQEIAHSVQAGVNQRIDAAQNDPSTSVAQAQQSMDEYNAKTLEPYLMAWAAQQALSDVYASTPSPDGTTNMRDSVNWIWTQATDFQDDCAAAADASPNSYSALVSIAGGEPPVHRRCACSLDPAT